MIRKAILGLLGLVISVVLTACSTNSPSAVRGTTGTSASTSATSLPTTSIVPKTSNLDSYVSAETASEAFAAKGSSQAVWPSDVSERSPIVEVGGTPISVVAYGFDPTGRPVQVLAEEDGAWTDVASLPPPSEPGTVSHPDSLYLYASGADGVDNLAGSLDNGTPAFFIPFTSGGCSHGPVVSEIDGSWRYLSFIGGDSAGEVVAGNPRFVGDTLVTDNDCAASVPSDQQVTWTWTYDVASGATVITQSQGWPQDPGRRY